MAADQHRRALAEEIEAILRDELDWPKDRDPDGAVADVLARAASRIAALSGREVEAMREAAAKAVLGTSYGPPSHWPGSYPRGWRHPPLWSAARTPTPEEACWHDNGVNDAYFALRALTQEGRSDG